MHQASRLRDSRLEDRIHHLARQYAIAVLAYVVMSNHVHLVIATDPGMTAQWEDVEVVRRWRQVFPVRRVARGANAASTDVPAEPEPTVAPETIATWRKRLGSISWCMRTLLEPRMHAPLRQGSSLGAMHAVRP